MKKTEEQQGSLHPKAWQNLGSCTPCVLHITTASLSVSSKPQSKFPSEMYRPGGNWHHKAGEGEISSRDSDDSEQSPASYTVPARAFKPESWRKSIHHICMHTHINPFLQYTCQKPTFCSEVADTQIFTVFLSILAEGF